MNTSLFTFEWPSQAVNSVYVTGTFDNWSKSTKLVQNKDGSYSVTIEVPKEKIMFKYVVDGTWLTTSKFKTEKDSTGIENNVIYPEDLSQYNDELLSTINENSSSFDVLSPEFRSSNDPHNYGVSYKSDTESSAFTNISVGDISPFENSDLDNPVNEDGGKIDNVINDDESFKSMSDEELFSSTQGTLLGVDTQSCNTSINHQQPNLVNLQSTNGSRQVRYYTSMSVLDRFKKYFK